MKVTKEQFADKLVKLFPEKKQALAQHYEDFGELLGHIFFSDEINVPLFDLLKKTIQALKYLHIASLLKRCGGMVQMM